MGGTTAKLTLIDDFTPQQSRHFEVARAYRFAKGSGFPVRIPVIDMVEIGAGGGSIARVDPLRRIQVGPDSAGSDPGPACYARGGTAPTVTDADVVLGRIDPARFAGGKIALDAARARDVVTAVGLSLHMPMEEAARGIAEIVDETMASAARVHAVENGKDTTGRTLIAFGGAAPLHAARLAQKLGIGRVVIPVDAGVGSAHGFLAAPVAYEVARTFLVRLDVLDHATIDALFAEMRAESEAVVRLGVRDGPLVETRTAFMRYRGQGHEVAVVLPHGPLDPASLRAAFDTTYARLFGRVIPRLEVEALTWTLALSQPYALPARAALPPSAETGAPTGHCRIIDTATGEAVQAAVFARASLPPGACISGPAVIVEDGTSTIVPPGLVARVAAAGELDHRGERAMIRRNLPEIELQIMWNRLLSVVEEQAQTLVRTAFSTSSREAGDISAGVFDVHGRMLAQAVTGTPGHINTMARSVLHFLKEFSVAQMQQGDVYITNDPWKGTGHLYDLVVVSPTFMDGRIVALFACTAHLVDMGGVGQTPEGRQIWHEGLFIPMLRLARAGEMNEDLLAMIRANVREPVQVIGDVYALIACNEIGSRRLVSMMREFRLDDLDMLGEEIITRSRRAMTEAIGKLPQGTWCASMRIDGYESPIDLMATVTIGRDRIDVDYAGTSGMSSYAINCPLCYTEAYTTFGVNCVVAPHVPNNTGTLDAVTRHGARRLHPECDVSRRGVCAGNDGTHAAGCGLWLSGPGDSGARAGGGHVEFVEPEAGGGAWADRHRREGRLAVHGDELSFGRGRRSAVAGRAVGDAVPVGSPERAGRDDRGDHSTGDLAQRVAAGFRWCGAAARRPRPGDGDRLAGERAVRDFRRVRAGEVPGTRAQRWRGRGEGAAVAGVGRGTEAEGVAGGAGGRSVGHRDARWRRDGCATRARSGGGAAGRAVRLPVARGGGAGVRGEGVATQGRVRARRPSPSTLRVLTSPRSGRGVLLDFNSPFLDLRFVHPQPQSRPFGQMEQPIHRLRRVLERRMRPG